MENFALFQDVLPNMKRFSLSSTDRTSQYDELIVPLLQRMINLEELALYLSIRSVSDYVDGAHLRNDILRYMPRLKTFHFGIETTVYTPERDLAVLSNEDVQRTFLLAGLDSFCAHVKVYPRHDGSPGRDWARSPTSLSHCHVYSLPYTFSCVHLLSNSFRGGNFQKVEQLTVSDDHPFEHEFFRIISRSFPRLRLLRVSNIEPQEDKQQPRTPVTFAQLTHLELPAVHADYVEQFLVDQHCHLPRLCSLLIAYDTLASATTHFTNDATRLTCRKLKIVQISEPFARPQHFDEYFASLPLFSLLDVC